MGPAALVAGAFTAFRGIAVLSQHLCRYAWAARGRSQDDLEILRGDCLYSLCVALGPLTVKAGQVLASRGDFFSPGLRRQLRRLHDDVSSWPERDMRPVLENAYGRCVEDVFEALDWLPIASGSIAQVHRATLPDGAVVAVKIVKPGVRRQLISGVRWCDWIVRTLHRFSPTVRELDLLAHFREIAPLLLRQSDMVAEAQAQEEIRANFLGNPIIRVPRVHSDYSNRTCLVMEFVHAVPGYRLDKLAYPRERLAARMQDCLYTMTYFHGLVHGDPHPGNLLFEEGGRIVLLDFGLCTRLSENEKWSLSAFYYACTRQQWALAIERFTGAFVMGRERLHGSLSEYRSQLEAVLRTHFSERSSRWSTVAFVDDASRVVRRHGARFTTTFTSLAVALVSGEGFISDIDPTLDIWANARRFTERASPYISAALRERFDQAIGTQIPQSIRLRERAADSLVAPTHLDRFVLPSAYPLIVRRASGCILEDVDGHHYIDLSSGYGPHILGYAHPEIVSAVQSAIASGAVNALGSEAEIELAELIVDALPSAERMIFSNSGTEAILMAIRLCRAKTGRQRVCKFEGHYHGFSDSGVISSWFRFAGPADRPCAVAPTAGVRASALDETLVLPFGDRAALARVSDAAEDLACVICEPMPSARPVRDREFLTELRAACSNAGIPLVFDEVVSGFRVAFGGAQQLLDVPPDLTCLGKVIGGGLPAGAVAGKAELIELAKSSGDAFLDMERKVFVGGTLSGNSVTCAAGRAALSHLKGHPEVYTQLHDRTASLTLAMREVCERFSLPLQVEGFGSILNLTFAHHRARSVREHQTGTNYRANLAFAYYMRKHGVYVPELHTLLLSDAHTEPYLNRVRDAFEKTLVEMVEDGFFLR